MNLKKTKILIVEDSKLWARHIWNRLEELGIHYEWVKNGAYAVKKIQENIDYDAIIMDIKMPVMGGFEAARKIRQLKFKKPIVGHTSFLYVEDKQQDGTASEESDINVFLSKGISCDPLIKTLIDLKVLKNIDV